MQLTFKHYAALIATFLPLYVNSAHADDPAIFNTGMSRVNAISADGQLVVGSLGSQMSIASFDGSSETNYDHNPTQDGSFNTIAPDNSFVVGSYNFAGHTHAVIFNGGFIDLNSIPGGINTYATGVGQSDGNTYIVGAGYDGSNHFHAVVWINGTAPTQLSELSGGTDSFVQAISHDGQFMVGYSNSGSHLGGLPTLWTGTSSVSQLALPSGGYDGGNAYAISGDNTTIVGQVSNSGAGTATATKWRNGIPTVLGTLLGDTNSYALAVNGDGSVIVGETDTRAFRYTQAGGMKDLNTLLTDAGVNMGGITLTIATSISDDGTLIAVNSNSQGYVVFYDAGIGGVTTLEAQQTATQALADDISNSLAASNSTAANLLGFTRPITSDSYTTAGVMFGSAEGTFDGQYSKNNFTILGGVAYGHQDYSNVDQSDTTTLALAGRYLFNPVAKNLRPYVELGAWGTPDETLTLHRAYANGVGTAVGTGNSGAYSFAGYGRLGLVYDVTPKDTLSTFVELGQQALHHAAYTEALSSANPFPTDVSEGLLRYDVARIGASATHTLATGKYPLTATVSGAIVQAFNADGTLRANVAGVGMTSAATSALTWGEFGASLGVALTNRLSANLGILGTSGDSNMGTALHGTAGVTYKF